MESNPCLVILTNLAAVGRFCAVMIIRGSGGGECNGNITLSTPVITVWVLVWAWLPHVTVGKMFTLFCQYYHAVRFGTMQHLHSVDSTTLVVPATRCSTLGIGVNLLKMLVGSDYGPPLPSSSSSLFFRPLPSPFLPFLFFCFHPFHSTSSPALRSTTWGPSPAKG